MGNAVAMPPISMADYLQAEESGPIRHEYAAGHLFAMAGGSKRHARISLNVAKALDTAASDEGCATYVADMRVRVSEVVYYPDVMVVCENDAPTHYTEVPCLIAEVLSESTERIDRGEKLYNYRQIGTLLNYLLIAQDRVQVDLYRRKESAWLLETYVNLDDEIALDCPGCSLLLKHIYQQVEFEKP